MFNSKFGAPEGTCLKSSNMRVLRYYYAFVILTSVFPNRCSKPSSRPSICGWFIQPISDHIGDDLQLGLPSWFYSNKMVGGEWPCGGLGGMLHCVTWRLRKLWNMPRFWKSMCLWNWTSFLLQKRGYGMLTYYLGYPEWGVPIEIFFLGMLFFLYYPISGHIWLTGLLARLEEKRLWILKLQTYAKLKVPTTQLVECLPAIITSVQQFSPNSQTLGIFSLWSTVRGIRPEFPCTIPVWSRDVKMLGEEKSSAKAVAVAAFWKVCDISKRRVALKILSDIVVCARALNVCSWFMKKR